MTRAFRLEVRKLKRTRLWVPVGAVLVFESGWVMAALVRTFAQQGEVARDTGYVLGQLIQVHGLFAPILVAVIASRLSAVEHEADMVKQLFAMNQSRQSLFRAKFATVLIVVLLYTAAGGALLLAFGSMTGVAARWELIGIFLSGLIAANLAPISIHLLLALLIARQAVTLGLGIVGGVLGTFVGFVPTAVSLAVPWHHYGVVNPVRMEVENGSVTGFPAVSGTEIHVAVVAVVGAVLFCTSQWIYRRSA
ncbi:hypothetical protein F4561_004236 [Lipingzhangella halophila]|uniref:ABC-2 type transport system permease protein n=1 Tax=Lipingzhangella halophila TaxID=1783352 RepID=A0A7W7RKX5_9ACTN|nr:ABC transporter permease [Lipingzhangella halophila]MBB4933416.1 hypothetical protein [Lipingzhangella halophila]